MKPKGWTNPVKETERHPENNARVRLLSEDEYERLLKAAKVSYWNKLHVLIKLAVTTGARRGTLMALRWADVDLGRPQAFAERTKNGEPFVLVLRDDVARELKGFKGQAHPGHLVFCRHNDPFKPVTVDKAYKFALERAGIKGAVFHTLRHTHASWMARTTKASS